MRTKIVYVLVSRESDYYYEMLGMSLYSLRLYHPKDTVEVVMDEETYSRLNKRPDYLKQRFNPIVVDIPPGYKTMQKSRYLKTNLRSIVSGDFLYIDLDTIICCSLEDVDRIDYPIGVVLENHGAKNTYEDPYYPKGWEYVLSEKHYNGGVLYVKDCEQAYSFYNQWHNNWKYCVENGCDYDQPGLRKTILESDVLIKELGGQWNCQVSRETSQEYQSHAKIIHYQRSGFIVSLCKCIRKSGRIQGDIAKWLETPRDYFSTRKTVISKAEYSALEPLRFTLHNYPRFFRFLTHITLLHNRLVNSLYRIKSTLRNH